MLVSTRNSDASRVDTADIDESFPPERRLRARREFTSALRRGIKHVSSSVVVYAHARQRNSSHQHRLGIVISKRVGVAVRRNGIKRCVRESFRRETLPTTIPIDFVCIARRRKDNDLAKLTSDVRHCLHRLAHKIKHTGESSGFVE
ncbi:MAG: ribonuclease P protein component [Pseudomonadota bacterium]|nr:ribonuclease P protein component [Pseudomonadota bacterium]